MSEPTVTLAEKCRLAHSSFITPEQWTEEVHAYLNSDDFITTAHSVNVKLTSKWVGVTPDSAYPEKTHRRRDFPPETVEVYSTIRICNTFIISTPRWYVGTPYPETKKMLAYLHAEGFINIKCCQDDIYTTNHYPDAITFELPIAK